MLGDLETDNPPNVVLLPVTSADAETVIEIMLRQFSESQTRTKGFSSKCWEKLKQKSQNCDNVNYELANASQKHCLVKTKRPIREVAVTTSHQEQVLSTANVARFVGT